MQVLTPFMIDRYESPYGIICDQVELPSTSAANLVGFPKSHHLPPKPDLTGLKNL